MALHLANIEKQIALGFPVGVVQKDQLNQQADIIDGEQQEVKPGPNSQMETEFEQIANGVPEPQEMPMSRGLFFRGIEDLTNNE
jgi:hypothetical protein